METPPLNGTAPADDRTAYVALDVIAQLREETAEALGALDAPEPNLRGLDKPTI